MLKWWSRQALKPAGRSPGLESEDRKGMRLRPLSEKVGTIVSASTSESLKDLALEPIQDALKRTGAVFQAARRPPSG